MRVSLSTICLLVLGLMSAVSPGYLGVVAASPQAYSWNPHVSCHPVVVTIEQVLGNQSSSLGGALEIGSSFAPGIGDKRSLSPPCTIANAQGQIVSVFVQINNVLLVSVTNQEDCSTIFSSSNGGGPYPNAGLYCDTDTSLHTSGQSGNCSSTDTSGCMHRIFFEIDRDWEAAGYCGTGTMCNNSTMHQVPTSTPIDVQGFLYWDSSDTSQPWHSFSGWDVHPLTAWKLSSSSPPAPPPPSLTVGFTWSPTAPQVGQQPIFSSGVFGGTPPYTVSWSFGDGGTLVSSSMSTTHTYSAPASYNVTLSVTDSGGLTGHASYPLLVPLTISTSWNPHVACTALVVTIEELLGQPNSSGVASLSASPFNPGVPNKRTLNQPCTITNVNGQAIGAFVEIRGVERDYSFESDWSTSFDSSNGGGAYPPCPNSPCTQGDTTDHIYNPAFSPTCSTRGPNCTHILQFEIDHDWKGAGYCGIGTACDNNTLISQTIPFSTVLDVQGFVYWDPDHVGEASHSFSGWELHPLTGWRQGSQAPDVAVSSESPSRAFAYNMAPSNAVLVNVTAQNLGTGSETFTVYARANSTLIGNQSVTVNGGTSRVVTFAWHPEILARGSYILTANITRVSGEANFANNQLTGGKFTVRFRGDISGDCKVDLTDLILVTSIFASTPSAVKWNPNADLNNDGIIDLSDLILVAGSFGQDC